MAQHPDRYPPGRTEFLAKMTNMPGLPVGGGAYADLLERSKSTCGPHDFETTSYVLVKIASGASKDQRGWICETSIRRMFP
jgi:hypothetical protein